MLRRFLALIIMLCFALGCYYGISAASSPAITQIKDVRYFASKDYVRVVIDLLSLTKFKKGELKDSKKIYFDIEHASVQNFTKRQVDVDNSIVKRIRVGQFDKETVRVVVDLDNFEDYKIFTLVNPDRLVVDIYGARDNSTVVEKQVDKPADKAINEKEIFDKPAADAPPVVMEAAKAKEPELIHEPVKEPPVKESDITKPEAAKETFKLIEKPKEPAPEKYTEKIPEKLQEKLPEKSPQIIAEPEKTPEAVKPGDTKHKAKEKDTRQAEALIAKKTIVIDPGHGGHDPGAMSKSGLKEKDVVLDISLQLARILREKYYFDVHMTRSDDTFISLDERTAIANGKRADLFVSIHANANNSSSLNGIETYFLNFSNSDEAMRVAARENAISMKQMKEVQSDLGLILASLARESKRDESLHLSHYIQKSLISKVGKRHRGVTDHGVKQALFYVLVGASMPAALVEVSYITNPTEEKLLNTDEYKELLAQSIAAGINKYVTSLPDSIQYAKAAAHKK
ncbi:MAG: N-acetylmuramoyl-L-alanine amidase [Nitrospirae bacterium]|nr:N-acetylmuramoyl-L-alanine amidase [Nitrospirota bacterium]